MVLRFLLRPAVLASVVVHGAAVAAAYMAVEAERPAREPLILASLSSDLALPEEAAEIPELLEPDPDPPTEQEPVVVEPPPVVEDVPEPAAPPAEASLISIGGLERVPMGLRTSRAKAVGGSVATTPASLAVPAAAPAESRRGAGVTRWSVARPENARPAYPAAALSQGVEGTVLLALTVRADGTAADVRIERSSGSPELDDAAVDAATTWRFEPKLVDGVAVDEALRVPVRFRIVAR